MAKLRKIANTREGGEESVISTYKYIIKVIEDACEDDDFTHASWLSVLDYVNVDGGIVTGCFVDVKKYLKNGKLKKVVAVIKSCTSNALGDLIVTLKDLSGTISGTIHYKLLTEERFAKAITVGAALILHNVFVFSHKFETYVKSKDLDLWHVITNGEFQPIEQNLETKLDEYITLALKANKESSDEECLTFESEDKEYAMAVRDFKKFFKRRDKNQRAFIGGSWSDSGEKDDEKAKDETCLVAQALNEELVRNLPKLKFDQHFCDTCKTEKQALASHKAKNIVSMTRCLELIHMDLFGPSSVWSYRGNLYTLVIVDDYSRSEGFWARVSSMAAEAHHA
nr:hypothetical protein [Tanacetum cinerariifolium]